MKIIGFNFSKIAIEKKGNFIKAPEVKTSMDISNIKEVQSELFKSKETALEIKFVYGIKYSPEIAELNFEGNLMLLVDSKEAKEIIKKWKAKDIPEDLKLIVFNTILRKSNIKALQLEDELNLPIHFQLPSLKFKKE